MKKMSLNKMRAIVTTLILTGFGCGAASLCTGSRAEMFNREAAAPEAMAEKVVAALNPVAGQVIADIGAGGGYFSYLFAKKVTPSGKVYAVELNSESLQYIRKTAEARGLKNIITIQAKEDRPNLMKNGIDLVFMRNVFHELPDQKKYFHALLPFLKQGGRIAVLEYKNSGRFSHVSLFGHYTPEEQIVKVLSDAGYERVDRYVFLPEQSFNVFAPVYAGGR
jgi:ubiquinone/menaquinone biosynthesis C-methylase UbiE